MGQSVPAMAPYLIVPGASEVLVGAKSTVHAIDGQATHVAGSLEIETDANGAPRTLAGRIEVPIASLRSGNGLYDAELQRRVDARRHPTIVGQVRTAVRLDNDGLFRVEGDVTFHGVTRVVEGEVLVHPDGDRLTLEGERVFDVRDFGIKPPRMLMLKVEPTVRVRIRLVAERT